MNIYRAFFEQLKVDLIRIGRYSIDDFKATTESEIEKVYPNLPLAYVEWLKVFGKIYLIMNFPYESYSLEELEECNTGDALDYADLDELKNLSGKDVDDLVFISCYESLYIFMDKEGENPMIYHFYFNNRFIKEYPHKMWKFTTYIKHVIFSLIHKTPSENEIPLISLNYPNRQYLYKYDLYIKSIKEMEQEERVNNRIMSFIEFEELWKIKVQEWNDGKFYTIKS